MAEPAPPAASPWTKRLIKYWLVPTPTGTRDSMRIPRLLRLTGGIKVFRDGAKPLDPPERPTYAQPEYPNWLDMSEKEVLSVPFALITWLLPRRAAILAGVALAIALTLAFGGSFGPGIALFCELLIGYVVWRVLLWRVVFLVTSVAVVLTVAIGWSVGQLLVIGLIWLLAAGVWDFVNAVRYTDEFEMSQRFIQMYKGVFTPERLPRVGGESIDEVSGKRSFFSNRFGWDVGRIKIRTTSGKDIVRKHVGSWSQVMALVDDINEAGGMSREQALTLLQVKAAFMRGELTYEDILEDVGQERADVWVEAAGRKVTAQLVKTVLFWAT